MTDEMTERHCQVETAAGFALMELVAVMALASIFLVGVSAIRRDLVRQAALTLQAQHTAVSLRSAAERLDTCTDSLCAIADADQWERLYTTAGCVIKDRNSGLSLPSSSCGD